MRVVFQRKLVGPKLRVVVLCFVVMSRRFFGVLGGSDDAVELTSSTARWAPLHSRRPARA